MLMLIGFGAIGQFVHKHLGHQNIGHQNIGHQNIGPEETGSSLPDTPIQVLVRPGREDEAQKQLGPQAKIISDLKDIAPETTLAIECAGHVALREHGPEILRRGIDLLTVSTGALADPALEAELTEAATAGGSVLELASGAIGAIDAITAAREGGLTKLVYRGRKPPKGWKGSPAEAVLDLDGLTEPTAHFSGTARQAALRYPKNANVAASIAMAGNGLDQTTAELIADPTIDANIHEVEAEGAFGKLSFRIDGKGLPGNPRSSALTAMSVIAAVKRRQAKIRQ